MSDTDAARARKESIGVAKCLCVMAGRALLVEISQGKNTISSLYCFALVSYAGEIVRVILISSLNCHGPHLSAIGVGFHAVAPLQFGDRKRSAPYYLYRFKERRSSLCQ